MSTVDKRVVEMGFDNRQFESGVSTSLKTLDKLKGGLDFSGAGKGLLGIGENVQNISNRFSAFGVIGFTVLQNLTNMAMGLGEKLLSAALGLDAMSAGFGSYEVKINAVKTVMSGTGETIDQVTQSLDELNRYSDRTIYSFQDMTENISKFTNAGLSSKAAATVIQGISNVAAVSGANTQEAARAMYNFGQAMQQGSVRLMDWKSIENANMATIEFKTQLINTAVAMGTLKKQADGTYKTLSGEVMSATINFNGSLEKQWLTTDVLTKTLGDYASQTTEIGKKANSAAQDVKTFSQMMATIADAQKTGWTKSWQIVIGDLNESTALFTDINNIISGILGKSAETRNNMLQSWKDAGGRGLIIRSLMTGFESLSAIMKPIKESFKEIFPDKTVATLLDIERAILNFTYALKPTAAQGKIIFQLFRNIFSIFDIGIYTIESIVKAFLKLGKSANLNFMDMVEWVQVNTEWISSIQAVLRKGEGFSFYLDKIRSKLAPLTEEFKKFLSTLGPSFSKVSSAFGKVKTILSDTFKNIDLSGITGFTTKVNARFTPLTALLHGVGSVFGWLGKVILKLGPVFGKIGEMVVRGIGDLGSGILNGLNNLDYNKIFDVLNGGLLAALIIAIKKFVTQGTSTLSGISGILDGVKGSLTAWQKNLQADTLKKIAVAIGILALSLIGLTLVDSTKLSGALASITAMFIELSTTMSTIDKNSSSGLGGALGKAGLSGELLAISAAILVLTVAVTALSKIDSKKMMNGLIGIGTILAELAIFTKLTNEDKASAVKGLGLMSLAVSLLVLSVAVEKLGKLDASKLQQGLIAIGAILGELAIFVKLTSGSKNIVGVALGLTVIGAAMLIFASAVDKMGSLPLDTIAKGLATMAGSLVIVIGAFRLMPNNMLVNSVALLGVAAALVVISKALTSMGGMSWEEIAKGLVALAGSLLVISVAILLMKTALPGAAALLVVAGALAIFVPVLKILGSMSLEEIGLSLLALAGTFAVIGVAGLLLGPLTPVLLALAGAMALFGIACLTIGLGVQAFAFGLSVLAVSGTAAAATITIMVSSLLALIPLIVAALVGALVQFAQMIANAAPTLVTAIVSALQAVLTGITGMIPTFVTTILTLVTSLLTALVNAAPQLVQGGVDLLLALLKGITDNIPKIVQTAVDLIAAFLKSIGEQVPKVVDAAFRMVISFIEGLSKAIDDNAAKLGEVVGKLASSIINGLVNGLLAGGKAVVDAVLGLARQALAVFGLAVEAKSPSKAFFRYGMYIDQGLVNGIVQFAGTVERATRNLGETAKRGLTDAVTLITEDLNSNVNLTPSIRPVVDLSEVIAGGNRIDKLLGNKILNVDLAMSKLSSISGGMSGSKNSEDLINQPLVPGATNLSFTQNNYSPKELSRIDIYRQTKNQFLMLKGLVPVND